ncbi:MAG: sulfocyanin-like copper-binding protein [Actinomycetota bacterium]
MQGTGRMMRAAAVAILAGGLFAACSSANAGEAPNPVESQPPASAAVSGTQVNVQLGETDVTHMYMKIDTTSVPAGTVTFSVQNQGVKTHEFVVLKTDTPAGDFPLTTFEGEKNRIDEDADGVNVGETGDMDAGTSKTLTVELKPGHYALVCNLAGHYRMGMYSDFQVK